MPESFDPYSCWLGIEPEDQPLDHYRLLGVNRFEEDVQVIEAAADARMAMIRKYQTGPRGQFTQPVLNRLAAAKLCLLNAASKATYDAVLQGLAMATQDDLGNADIELPPEVAVAATHPAPPVTSSTPASASVDQVFVEPAVVVRAPRSPRRRRRRSKRQSNLVIAICVIVVIVLAAWIIGISVMRSFLTAATFAD